MVSYFPVWRVECEGCGMSGPMSPKNKTEAAQLWNELPRTATEDG